MTNLGHAYKMLRTQCLLTLCAILFANNLFGTPVDSTTKANNPRFVMSLDTRSTIIDRRHIRINGALTGVSFGQKNHKITMGYYWLGYDASKRLINWHKSIAHSINLSYYTKTDVQFISFAYWLPVLKKNKWTLSVPLEMGLGRETSRYRALQNDAALDKKNAVFEPYQCGVYSEYKLTPWFGIDAQVGYRNALSKTHFQKHFAGIYYSYGLSLYPGTIYQDYKSWRKKEGH